MHAIQDVVASVVPSDVRLDPAIPKNRFKARDEVWAHGSRVGVPVVEPKVGVARVVGKVGGTPPSHRGFLFRSRVAAGVEEPAGGAGNGLYDVEAPRVTCPYRVSAHSAVGETHQRDPVRIHAVVTLNIGDHIENVLLPHPAPHHLAEAVR